MKQMFRTVLVVGDDPDRIIKKYSADTKVEEHLFLKKTDAGLKKEETITFYKKVLEIGSFLNAGQETRLKDTIMRLSGMTPEEYFQMATEGCTYDIATGDAYTDNNPDAYYRNERSPQKAFEATGEETGFCNPFKLKGGYVSYSAEKGEIDWGLNHLNNRGTYEAAWELVVDGREPKDDKEKLIKGNMVNRKGYFEQFGGKEDYVLYSTSFWTYGIATDGWYKEAGMDGVTDKEWVRTFYDNFIKGLPDGTLLTIYEVNGID